MLGDLKKYYFRTFTQDVNIFLFRPNIWRAEDGTKFTRIKIKQRIYIMKKFKKIFKYELNSEDHPEIAWVSSKYNDLGKEDKTDFLNVMRLWLNKEMDKLEK